MGDTWKKFERKVARAFGVERNPLSGSNSRHTYSDTLHETLYIECKSRVSHPIIDDWNVHKNKARRRGLPCLSILIEPQVCETRLWMWKWKGAPNITGTTWVTNYVVPHYRKRDSLRSLYEGTVPLARDEHKVPVVAAGQKGRPGFWLVTHPTHVEKVLCAQ